MNFNLPMILALIPLIERILSALEFLLNHVENTSTSAGPAEKLMAGTHISSLKGLLATLTGHLVLHSLPKPETDPKPEQAPPEV